MPSRNVTEKYTFEHWHLVIWMTKFKITSWFLVHAHFWPTCRFMNLLNLPHLIKLIQQLQIQLEFLNFMAKIINLNLFGPGSILAYGTIFLRRIWQFFSTVIFLIAAQWFFFFTGGQLKWRRWIQVWQRCIFWLTNELSGFIEAPLGWNHYSRLWSVPINPNFPFLLVFFICLVSLCTWCLQFSMYRECMG